ncbi:SH3 domain-containing protein [Maribacter algicola]|uniref:SH3 domain-containing protein n=1 Tax=Meishania litoralis TaxID=3434685 RepID=A0ACC7LPG2_9FLAO
MRSIFIISSFLLTNYLNAQEVTKGLILPDEGFDVCCYYIPTSGLTIYNQPNGATAGKLTLGTPDNNKEVYSASIQVNGKNENFGYPNLQMVGYEIMAMTFKDARSNFVQLQNGYWLDIDELTSKQLKVASWMDYTIEKDTEWYANDPGLNLRESPSTDSKILATLKGDLWGIRPTDQTNGNWCKVEVIQYRKHPCSGEDNLIISTLVGWVKLISDEQTSNVWNYGKGC